LNTTGEHTKTTGKHTKAAGKHKDNWLKPKDSFVCWLLHLVYFPPTLVLYVKKEKKNKILIYVFFDSFALFQLLKIYQKCTNTSQAGFLSHPYDTSLKLN
jgi:hypothetical protein